MPEHAELSDTSPTALPSPPRRRIAVNPMGVAGQVSLARLRMRGLNRVGPDPCSPGGESMSPGSAGARLQTANLMASQKIFFKKFLVSFLTSCRANDFLRWDVCRAWNSLYVIKLYVAFLLAFVWVLSVDPGVEIVAWKFWRLCSTPLFP